MPMIDLDSTPKPEGGTDNNGKRRRGRGIVAIAVTAVLASAGTAAFMRDKDAQKQEIAPGSTTTLAHFLASCPGDGVPHVREVSNTGSLLKSPTTNRAVGLTVVFACVSGESPMLTPVAAAVEDPYGYCFEFGKEGHVLIQATQKGTEAPEVFARVGSIGIGSPDNPPILERVGVYRHEHNPGVEMVRQNLNCATPPPTPR